MGNPSHLRVVGRTSSSDDEQQVLSLVFAALSDPVRREILDRLDGHDLLVSEIAAHFDPSRRAALYADLDRMGSQVFMTGADPAAFAETREKAIVFNVSPGRLMRNPFTSTLCPALMVSFD